MHIGRKIKVARVSKGLTQQDLAEKINKTRPLISHIEQTGKISAYTLNKISAVLNIDFNDVEQVFTDNKGHYTYKKENADALKVENERLRKEIDILHELIESQKEVIKGLKEKSKRKYK